MGMNFQIRNPGHRNYLTIGIHILIWGLIFNIPFFSTNPPATTIEYVLRIIPYLLFAAVFYVNYFYLVPRFLFSKRYIFFFLYNIIVYALCILILREAPTWQIFEGINRRVPRFDVEFVLRRIISLVTMTGISVAIRITGRWFQSESLRKDLEKEHLQSELMNLKNQLNPHFFFNTLNTIYGLIVQDQTQAQDAVHRLSKLMRYLLYDSNEKYVPLSKEIDFIKHYIDLMKLRSAPDLKVCCTFPVIVPPDLMIAPLLFISLIENGFKHGISGEHASEIIIRMDINYDFVVFIIRNTDFAKKDNDKSGSGIGLKNLKKRLNLLYPVKHIIDFRSEKGIFESILTLKL